MPEWKAIQRIALLACWPLVGQAQAVSPPKAYEACAACHSFKPGEHLNGPSLYQLMQRPAGSVEGYRYSGPLKRSGLVWDAKNLRAFLKDPQALVPGNRMPFSGTSSSSEIDELVTFLVQMSGQQ